MLSVLLEFSMFPTSDDCRDGSSVAKEVSKIVDMIDASGYSYKLTPMGSIVEFDSIDEALDLIKRAYKELSGCERVYSALKFDIRKGCKNRLKTKIESVEKNLGREVSK